jgi:hypothetical protein
MNGGGGLGVRMAFTLCGALAVAGCGPDRTVARYVVSLEAESFDDVIFAQDAGDLVVVGEVGRDSIGVDAKLRTSRSSRHDEEAKDAVVIDLVPHDDETGELIVDLRSAPRGYYLDVDLRVPARLAMTIDDDSGDLVVKNLAYLTLDDGSGDAVVEDIAHAAVVVDGSGDLVVQNVGGSLSCSDDSGDLVIEDVGGDVRVDDGSGDLVVRRVGGDATIDDGSGDIVVRDVDGLVTVRDGSGDIVVTNAGAVEIPQRGSGDVHVE